MTAPDRASRLESLRALLRMMRASDCPQMHWKDALAIIEAIAPEPSIVPELVALLDHLSPYDRFIAITLLGENRHPDAWPALERQTFDETAYEGDSAAGQLARVGGDAGHARLLERLPTVTHPRVRDRVLGAIRLYDRPDGAVAIRRMYEAGAISALDAAVRISRMSVPLETIAAWRNDGGPDARRLALEIAISRASPSWDLKRRADLPRLMRGWVRALLDSPPRPLEAFERARLQGWLDEDESPGTVSSNPAEGFPR